jgi:hypothetical protein
VGDPMANLLSLRPDVQTAVQNIGALLGQ